MSDKSIETPEQVATRVCEAHYHGAPPPYAIDDGERAIRARDEQIVARLRDVLPMCMRDGESTLDMLEDIIRDLGGEIDRGGSRSS